LSAVTTRSTEKPGGAATEGAPQEEEQTEEEADKPKAPAQVEEVVFVYNSGTNTVTAAKVVTGISDFENIEIISGIKPGQQVVAGPFRAVSSTLKDGAKVAVKDAKTLDKSAIAAEITED